MSSLLSYSFGITPHASTSTTVVVKPPPSYQAGDLLVMCAHGGVASPGVVHASTPAGWTARSAANAPFGVFTKTAVANEPSVTVTFSGTCVAIVTISAYPPATVGTTSFGNNGGNSSTYTPTFPGGVTGSQVVLLFAGGLDYGSSATSGIHTLALPASWTAVIPPIGESNDSVVGGLQATCIGLAEHVGSTGNPTITSVENSTLYAGFLVLTITTPANQMLVTAQASGAVLGTVGGSNYQGVPQIGMALTVEAISGAQSIAAILAGGATAKHYSAGASATPSLAITPKGTGSRICGALMEWQPGVAYTAAAGTTFSQNVYDSSNLASYGTFHSTAAPAKGAATTYGATAPANTRRNIALAEILAAGTLSVQSTVTALGQTAADFTTPNVQQTAIFRTQPAAGVLLVAYVSVNSNFVQNGSISMSLSDTNNLTWTPLVESNDASGAYAGIWVAQVPAGASGGHYILNDDFNGGSWTDVNGVVHSGSSGVAGTLPSSSIWNVLSGTGGSNFGGGHIEWYVNDTSVVFQDGASNLVVKLGVLNSLGVPSGDYPTARLDTSASGASVGGTPKYAVQAGQSCEIRAKIFPFQGAWPALWFAGVNSQYTGGTWAEIDMEESGDPNINQSFVTIWGTNASGGTPLGESGGFNVGDGNYHTWRLDLTEGEIQIFIDGTLFYTLTQAGANAAGGGWDFTTQGGMYVILVCQVDPSAGYGTPNAASLPAEVFAVDYVRIWSPAGPDPNTGNVFTATGSVAVPKPALAGIASVTAAGAFTATGGLQVPKPGLAGIGTNSSLSGSSALATLIDAFGSNDLATLWANSYGTVGVATGRCSIQADTGYSSALESTSTYNLTGSSIFAQVSPYLYADGETALQLYLDGNNEIIFEYAGGSMTASIKQAGVVTQGPFVTYNATNHAWWRIREAAGTIFFDTAPDASTWTNFWSVTYTMAITALTAGAFAGVFSPGTVTGTAFITNINTNPNALSMLTDSFDSNNLATLWSHTFGTVAVAASQCSIQADTAYDSGLESSITYNIVSSYVFAQVLPYIAPSAETGLQIVDAAGNTATIIYAGGQLLVRTVYGGVTVTSAPITYSATAHAWWRIREALGTLYFDVAPDGLTWTNIYSSVYSMTATAVSVLVYAGDFGSDATGTSFVTDVNVPPVITSGSIAVPKPAISGVVGSGTSADTTSTGSAAVPKPGLSGSATVLSPVTSLGTPTMVRSTSGSVTGSWGTGQTTAAGDLLVAVVSAAAATSVTAIACSTSGWVLQQSSQNTPTSPHAYVAVWTKTAVGSDAAPTFTTTLTGTGAMTVTLLELPEGNQIAPLDIAGTFASGASTGTLSAMSAATAAANGLGQFAIGAFVQEAAAATNTWNESGTGFTNVTNDGATSSVAHTAVDTNPGPGAGATITDAGHWTTNATAFGAGLVVVFLPILPPGIPLYALADGFTVNDLATLWDNSFGTVTVSADQVSINTDPSYDSSLVSTSAYSVYGYGVFGKFGPYTADGTGVLSLKLYSDANNAIEILYFNGSMTAQITQAGVLTFGSTVAYNATNHAWWQILESGGTLFFQTAPDGVTWTTLWSTTYNLDLSAMFVQVLAGDTAVTSAGSIAVPKPALAGTADNGILTETAGAAYAHSNTNAVTSGSYTPTAGALQVAIVSWGNGNGIGQTSLAITDTSGSGSWTLLKAASSASGGPYCAIWCRDAWSGAATVTATALPSTVVDCSIIVRQFANALPAASQPGVTASVFNTSNQNLSITPGTVNSQVVGAFGTGSGAKVLTANGTTSIYGQYDGGVAGDTEAAVEAAALSVAGTPISVGFTNTAALNSFALAEILPA